MKNNFLKIMTVAIVITACDRNAKPENNSEQRKNDSLQGIVDQKDAVINNFLSLFNGIQTSLDSISKREKNILIRTEKPSDVKSVAVQEINQDIQAINQIIKTNQDKISSINRKLKNAMKKNSALETAMSALNQKLMDKESDLETLKNRLNQYDKDVITLETTIGILKAKNTALEETVAQETELLHTAYYITGSSKSLQKDSIIDKKGGLLAIGRTEQLRSDVNLSKFKKIDYTQTTAISLDCKKIKIITNHPSASYHLEEGKGIVRELIINDPKTFWSASKYLVIIKD